MPIIEPISISSSQGISFPSLTAPRHVPCLRKKVILTSRSRSQISNNTFSALSGCIVRIFSLIKKLAFHELICILAANDEIADHFSGLKAGADKYLKRIINLKTYILVGVNYEFKKYLEARQR